MLRALLSLALAAPGPGDTLTEILARGSFTWGADEEGGGPYVFPDPADPERRVGLGTFVESPEKQRGKGGGVVVRPFTFP